MFNNNIDNSTENTQTVNVSNAITTLGQTINNNAKSGSPFFSSILKTIEKAAPQAIANGALSGLASLAKEGGSIAASLLGKLFSSFSGGSSTTVSSVNLTATMHSEYKFSATQVLPGWTDILYVPISGLIPSSDNPLYNEPLGVWNLANDPVITLHIDSKEYYKKSKFMPGTIDNGYYKTIYSFYYYLNNDPKIILNPVISNDFKIQNVNFEIVADTLPSGMNITSYDPYAYMNNSNFYLIGGSTYTSSVFTTDDGPGQYPPEYSRNGTSSLDMLVRASFNLVNKTTNDTIYISKYFYPSINKVYNIDKVYEETNGGPINGNI